MNKFEVQKKDIIDEFNSKGNWTEIRINKRDSKEDEETIYDIGAVFEFEKQSYITEVSITERIFYAPVSTIVDVVLKQIKVDKERGLPSVKKGIE